LSARRSTTMAATQSAARRATAKHWGGCQRQDETASVVAHVFVQGGGGDVSEERKDWQGAGGQ
jgi:hypothetical protein